MIFREKELSELLGKVWDAYWGVESYRQLIT